MPAKSHGKKRYVQKKQQIKGAPVEARSPAGEETPVAVATAPAPAVKPVAKPAPTSTQPAPRRYYLGRELLRVVIVTVIVTAVLFGLWWFLR